MSMNNRRHERGVTSLIIVMFSVLLLITITVSFVQLMIAEQIRSSDTELSQGAYDAAMAGVEDGKRVLTACGSGNTTACDQIANHTCRTVADSGFVNPEPNGEVYVKSVGGGGTDGKDFVQAYTCVKITRNTDDYKAKIIDDTSLIVPLKGESVYNQVAIEWYSAAMATPPFTYGPPTSTSLLPYASWPSPRPPVLRTQLIQYAQGNLNPASFDSDGNAHTLYLYPRSSGLASYSFATDVRRSGANTVKPVTCSSALILPNTYACRTVVDLPEPAGGSAAQRVAYLRLTSIYRGTDIRLQLLNSGTPVKFLDVQPSIDVTGRASDAFRRVNARVELADPLEASLYPRATLDITGSFCKGFSVTAVPGEYIPTPSCAP